MRRHVPSSSNSDSSEPTTTVSHATTASSTPRRRPARPSTPTSRPRRTRLASAPPDGLARRDIERARTSLPGAAAKASNAATTPTRLSSRRKPEQKQRASSQSQLDSDTSKAWSSHSGRQWSSRRTDFKQTSRNRSLSPILQRGPVEDLAFLGVPQEWRARDLEGCAGTRASTSRKKANRVSDQPCQLSTTREKTPPLLKNRTAKITEATHLHNTAAVGASSSKPSLRKKSIAIEITSNRPFRHRDDSLVQSVKGALQDLVARFLSKDRGSLLAPTAQPEEQVMSVTQCGTLGDAGSAPSAFAGAERASYQQSRCGEPAAIQLLKVKTSDSEFTEVNGTTSSTQQTEPSEQSSIAEEENVDTTLSEEAISITSIKRRQSDPFSREGAETNIDTGDDSLTLWTSSAQYTNSALVELESEMARNVLSCFFSTEKSVLPSAGEGAENCSVKQSEIELPKFSISAQPLYQLRTSGATGNFKIRSSSDFAGTSRFLVDVSTDQDLPELQIEHPELKTQKTPINTTCGAPALTRFCRDKGTVDAVEIGVEPKFPRRTDALESPKFRAEYTFPSESFDSQQRTKDSAPSSAFDMSAITLTTGPMSLPAQQKKEEQVVEDSRDTQSTEFNYNGDGSEVPSVPEIIIERKLSKSRYSVPPMPEENTQAAKEPEEVQGNERFSTGNTHVSIVIETSSRLSSRQRQPEPHDQTVTNTDGGGGSTIKDNESETTKDDEAAHSAADGKLGPEPPTSIPERSGGQPRAGTLKRGSSEYLVANGAKVSKDGKSFLFREQDRTPNDADARQKSQVQAGSLKAASQNDDVRSATKSAASTDKAIQTSGGEFGARPTLRIAHKASQASVSDLDKVTESALNGSSSVEELATKERRKKRPSHDKSKEKSTCRSLSKKGKKQKDKKKKNKTTREDKKPRREGKRSPKHETSTKKPRKSARLKGPKSPRSERNEGKKKEDKNSNESLLPKSPSAGKDRTSRSPQLLKTSKSSEARKRQGKYDKYRSPSKFSPKRKLGFSKSSSSNESKMKPRSKKRDATEVENELRSSSELSLKRKDSSKLRKRKQFKRRSRKRDDRAANVGASANLRTGGGKLCNFRFAVTYKPVIREGLSLQNMSKDGGATVEKLTERGESAARETEIKTTVTDGTAQVQDRKVSPQPPQNVAPRQSSQPKATKTSRSGRKRRQRKKGQDSDESLLSKPPQQEKDRKSKSPHTKNAKHNNGQKREETYDKGRSPSRSPAGRKRLSSKSSPRTESKRRSRCKKRKAKKEIESYGRSSSYLSLKSKQGSTKSRKRKRSKRRSRKKNERASSVRTAVGPARGGRGFCDLRFGVTYEPVIRGGLRPQKTAEDGGAAVENPTKPGELGAGENDSAGKTVFGDGTAEVQARKVAPQPAPRNVAQQPHTAAVADAERPEPPTADEKILISDSTSVAFREGATSSGVFQWSTTSMASICRAQRQFKWSTLRALIGAALADTFSSSTNKAARAVGDEEARLLRDILESKDSKHLRSKHPREKSSPRGKQKKRHRKNPKRKDKKRNGTKEDRAQLGPSTTTSPLIQRKETRRGERQKRRKDDAASPREASKPKEARASAAGVVGDRPQSSPRTAKGSPTTLSPHASARPSSTTAKTSTSGTKSRSSRRKRDWKRGKDKTGEKQRRHKKHGDWHKKRLHRELTLSSPSRSKRHDKDSKGSSVSSAAKLKKSRLYRVTSSKSFTKKTKSSRTRSSGTSKSETWSSRRKRRDHSKRGKRHRSRKDRRRDHTKSPKTVVLVDNASSRSASIFYCLSLTGVIATLVLIAFTLAQFYLHIVVRTVPPPPEHPTTSATTPERVEKTTRVHSASTSPRPSQVYYCETEFCTREGAYLSSLLSAAPSAPCVNFYAHVCGGWSRGHGDDRSSIWTLVSRNTVLQEEALDRVTRFLRQHQQQEVKAVANLYTACADSPSSDHVAEELTKMFARWTIGKWPTPRSRSSSFDDVWAFAAELSRELDLSTLLEVTTSVNPQKLEEAILDLDQPQSLFIQSDQQASQVMALFRSAIQDGSVAVGGTDNDMSNRLVERLMKALEVFASVPRKPTTANPGGNTGDMSIVRVRDLKTGVQRFLKELIREVGYLEDDGSVVVHCQRYLDVELELAMTRLSPHDVLDYMGFLVLIRVAPYVSSSFRGLRTLFLLSVAGRTVKDIESRSLPCAWLIEKTLPDCFAKASQLYRQSVGQDFPEREWLSRLEAAFARHTRDIVWISNFSSLVIRYRLKRQAVTQFGPRGQTICEDRDLMAATGPLPSYLQAASLQKRDKLRGIFRADNDLLKRVSGSDLNTEASYLPAQDVVHVPANLFGESASGNGTLSAFQLPRLAVRYYRGLVRMLFENIYEHDAPLSMGDEDHHRLTAVRSCFKGDVVQSPRSLRGLESLVPESPLVDAMLDQTTALLLAARAFEELLDVHRIWNLDLRFRSLPHLSFRQLFYVYYALDNCEKSDEVYRRHHAHQLPAEYRVNLVLRHDPRFASAFGCSEADAMLLTKNNVCRVLNAD